MWQSIADRAQWDAALKALPSPHALQAWAWGEFKSRWGWSAQRWLLCGEDSRPRAAVQVLRRRAGRLPLCVLYAPKGPAVVDEAAYQEALGWLEILAGRQRAIWVKADGDVMQHSHPSPQPTSTSLSASSPPGGEAAGTPHSLSASGPAEILRARRWQYSPNQVQFRNTLHNDLRHTDEELLAGMKPKWRYNIRVAEKHGVSVRLATRDDYATLYALYAETGRRDGFIIREPGYYYDAWQTMGAAGFLAEREGQALAGLVLFRFAERAWYFYGMSRSEGREHMPNHLLQWTAMRWARDNGCAVYDWWGAPERLDESDPLWGVYRFKDGFGAQFVDGLGAWDFAPFPWLYRLYVRWAPALLRRMRRRSEPAAAPQL
jgi:peptidoglycan pentaglycine glycine transferase (the first glycine)